MIDRIKDAEFLRKSRRIRLGLSANFGSELGLYFDTDQFQRNGHVYVVPTAPGQMPEVEGDPRKVGEALLEILGQLSKKYYALGEDWGIIGQYMKNRRRLDNTTSGWIDCLVKGLSDFEIIGLTVEQNQDKVDVTKKRKLPEGVIDTIKFEIWYLGHEVQFHSSRIHTATKPLAQILGQGAIYSR